MKKLDKKEKMLLVLSLLGFIFSTLLLIVDINTKNNISNSLCNISEYINCDRVASSSYSHIGPIPISLIGMIFYLFIPLYIIFSDHFNVTQKLPLKILSILSIIATIFSVYLFTVSVTKIKALCIFCTATYIVNIILLIYLLPNIRETVKIFSKDNIISFISSGLTSVVIALIGLFIINGILSNKEAQNELIKEYQGSEVYQVNTIFSPYIGSSNPKINIVIYSDLFCPACNDLMNNIERLMKDDKISEVVRVYFKHYPINKECNPSVGYDLHPGSCTASLLGFELMKKGLFWEYEREIRNSPAKDESTVLEIALNFIKDMNIKKIKEDNVKYLNTNILEGKALGINATPTWFINGRKIVGSYSSENIKQLINYILKN